MPLQDIISLLGVIVPLLAAVVLFVQSRLNKGDDVQLAATDDAHRIIETALKERGLDRRLDSVNERVEHESRSRQELERTFGAYRERALSLFVTREDYIANQARTDRKLDAIYREVHELGNKLHERTRPSS
ncbi:MAG: hypothetical protein AAGN64_17710 [Bacteroidota bacterium]